MAAVHYTNYGEGTRQPVSLTPDGNHPIFANSYTGVAIWMWDPAQYSTVGATVVASVACQNGPGVEPINSRGVSYTGV